MERGPQAATEASPLLAASARNQDSDTGNVHPEPQATVTSYGSEQDVGHDRHTNSDSPYLLDMSTTKFWSIFGPILFQYFVAMFDSYLMSSSHPIITSYFHASNSASWLSTSFMLTSTALQPLFGRLSDTIGRRPVYLGALVLFSAATTWCALAQSIGSFIAARAVCGIGAGAMMSMGNIITNDLVKIEVRGTYQAFINLLYGGGAACGAAFGGILCDNLGWRWAFGVQVPLVVVIFLFGYFTVPTGLGPQLATNSHQHWTQRLREFDSAGSLLLALSVAFLILGFNLGGNVLSWKHPFVITSLALSIAICPLLLWVESRAYLPVLPLAMVSKSPRANLIFSNFFSMVGINHVLFNAPLYFQAVHGESATSSGIRIAIPAVFTTLCGVSCGFWLTWTGRMKIPQVAGGISMLVGGLCLTLIREDMPIALATAFLAPPFMGQGLMFPATTLSLLAISAVEDQAIMTSTLILWRNLGQILGVSISSLILQNALLRYLNQYVTGPDKNEIIDMVRSSVRALLDLKGEHRVQAIHAYADALKITFLAGLVFFVVVNLLIIPVQLPRLGKRRVPADVVDEE